MFRSTKTVRRSIIDIQRDAFGRYLTAEDLHSLIRQHKPKIISREFGGEKQIFCGLTEDEMPLRQRVPEHLDVGSVVTLHWKPLFRKEQGSVSFRYTGEGYMYQFNS
jgi:hypothetical protein